MNPEMSLCEKYVILGQFLLKMTQFIEYAPRCQLGITNIADEIINV